MKKVTLEIENAKTKNVKTIVLPIISIEEDVSINIDLSSLNDEYKKIIEDAVDKSKKYTDIEMFYVDGDEYPNYGPDYYFSINDNILYGEIIRIKNSERRKTI